MKKENIAAPIFKVDGLLRTPKYVKEIWTNKNESSYFLQITNPVTKNILYVSLNQWDDDLVKGFRKVKIQESLIVDYISHKNNRFSGRCFTSDDKKHSHFTIVRIREGAISFVEGLETLVHELHHAADHITDQIKKLENRRECNAHLQGFFLHQIMMYLKPQIDYTFMNGYDETVLSCYF